MNKILKLATVSTISLLGVFSQSAEGASGVSESLLGVLKNPDTSKNIAGFLGPSDGNDMFAEDNWTQLSFSCKAAMDAIDSLRTRVNLTETTPEDYHRILTKPHLLENAKTLTARPEFLVHLASMDGRTVMEILPNVHALNIITNAPITQEFWEALAHLGTSLTHLSIKNEAHDFSNGDSWDIQPLTTIRWAKLTHLSLDGLYMGDDQARSISALEGLISLHVPYNHIGDDGVDALATMTNLTKLDVWCNRISEDGLSVLHGRFGDSLRYELQDRVTL